MKYPSGFRPSAVAPVMPTDLHKDVAKAERSRHEDNLLDAIVQSGDLPMPVREYQFHAERKWRADFAYPAFHLLIEVEGGHWTGGRHRQREGYAGDIEKYNEASLAGWTLLRVIPEMIEDGRAIALIRRGIHGRESSSDDRNNAVVRAE